MRKYKSLAALGMAFHTALTNTNMNKEPIITKTTFDLGFELGYAQKAISNPYNPITQPYQHEEWQRGYNEGYNKSKTQEV